MIASHREASCGTIFAVESARVSPGLCADCRHAAVIRSDRGQVYLQCRLAFTDPAFDKYPRLPVLVCRGYDGVVGESQQDSRQS